MHQFLKHLFVYDITVDHVPGRLNLVPDYLTRMPAPEICSESLQMDIDEAEFLESSDSRLVQMLLGGGAFYQRLGDQSFNDPLFEVIHKYICDGWPSRFPAVLG